jgi:hypothetical protein
MVENRLGVMVPKKKFSLEEFLKCLKMEMQNRPFKCSKGLFDNSFGGYSLKKTIVKSMSSFSFAKPIFTNSSLNDISFLRLNSRHKFNHLFYEEKEKKFYTISREGEIQKISSDGSFQIIWKYPNFKENEENPTIVFLYQGESIFCAASDGGNKLYLLILNSAHVLVESVLLPSKNLFLVSSGFTSLVNQNLTCIFRELVESRFDGGQKSLSQYRYTIYKVDFTNSTQVEKLDWEFSTTRDIALAKFCPNINNPTDIPYLLSCLPSTLPPYVELEDEKLEISMKNQGIVFDDEEGEEEEMGDNFDLQFRNPSNTNIDSNEDVIRLDYHPPLFVGEKSTLMGLKNDVDVVIADIKCPETKFEHLKIEEIGVIDGFSYIQMGKQNKRFLTFSSNLKYAAIAENKKLVFVYQARRAFQKHPNGKAFHTLVEIPAENSEIEKDGTEIIGIQFVSVDSNNTHLFILTAMGTLWKIVLQ